MALLERVAGLLNVDLSQVPTETRKSLLLDIDNQLMQLKTQAAAETAALRRLETLRTPKDRTAAKRREVEILTGTLARLERKRREVRARKPVARVPEKSAERKNQALEQIIKSLKNERKAR